MNLKHVQKGAETIVKTIAKEAEENFRKCVGQIGMTRVV